MTPQKLIEELIAYSNRFPEECATIERFIGFLVREPHCYARETIGHITASIWILDPTRSHVLLTHHKKFNQWIQLGGHADGDMDLRAVALKEGFEESGLPQITLISSEIFDIDIHDIPTRCTTHYDVRYLAVSNTLEYVVSEESHDLQWVPLSHVVDINKASTSLARMVHKTFPFTLLPTPCIPHEETTS